MADICELWTVRVNNLSFEEMRALIALIATGVKMGALVSFERQSDEVKGEPSPSLMEIEAFAHG